MIQYKKKKVVSFWTGYNAIFIIALYGLFSKTNYTYGSIIGFIIADMVGRNKGWHR